MNKKYGTWPIRYLENMNPEQLLIDNVKDALQGKETTNCTQCGIFICFREWVPVRGAGGLETSLIFDYYCSDCFFSGEIHD